MVKKTPATKILLGLLAELGDSLVDLGNLVTDISSHYGSASVRGGHAYVVELKKLHKQRDLKILADDLKKSNYIKVQKIGNRFRLSLTPKGQAATLAIRLKNTNQQFKDFYTVVIFDVPVSQSSVRRQFRLILKQGGFVMLQRSVWASKADVYNLVADFVRQLRLGKWINVFRATNFLNSPK